MGPYEEEDDVRMDSLMEANPETGSSNVDSAASVA